MESGSLENKDNLYRKTETHVIFFLFLKSIGHALKGMNLNYELWVIDNGVPNCVLSPQEMQIWMKDVDNCEAVQ